MAIEIIRKTDDLKPLAEDWTTLAEAFGTPY